MSRLLLIHPIKYVESSVMSRSYVRVPQGFRAPPTQVGDYVFGRIATQADCEPVRKIEPQPVEMTPGQQIALLTLRDSQLARAIVGKLVHSTARAGYLDYRELVHRGFAEPKGNGQYGHRITFPGRVHANILARKLAIELGINPHAFDVKRPPRYANSTGFGDSHFR